MSGAILALSGMAGASGGGGGGLGALSWASIYGVTSGSNAALTITGITGSISLSATRTGLGTLSYILNGTVVAYTGPFSVGAGDTLGWLVSTSVYTARSGTVTVNNISDSGAEVDTFNYVLTGNDL